ncbi:hypothetical protein LCGC14_1874370, partial [marine sediment metagenome]
MTNPPDTTIRLTWPTPDDGGGMIDKFILERKLSTEAWNSAEAKTIANGTQIDITPATQYATLNLTDGGTNYFEDTGLTSGLTYNLRMYAVDKAGNASIVSDEISAYSEDNAEPSVAPSGVSATAASGTSITVNWLPAADGVGIGGYVLYRVQADAPNPPNEWETKLPYLTGSNYELVLPTPIPLGDPRLTFSSGRYYFTDDKNGAGLIDNKLYFYRVRAYDTSSNYSGRRRNCEEQAGNNRLDSGAPTGSATTPDVTPPSKPITVLASTVSASQIDLDWLDSTDKSNDGVSNGSGVAGYNVYRAGPYDNIQSPPPTDGVYSKLNGPLVISSNYNSTSLAEFKYYYYKIEAIDNATNVSPRSDGASSQTFKDSVPTSPINLNATTPTGDPDDNSFIGRQITLTFNGSNSKYSRIDYYDVYRSEINYGSNAQWLALTPVETIAARTPKNGDGTYTHIDDNTGLYTHESNNLSDNKMYYFKVRAVDDTPISNVPPGPFSTLSSTVGSVITEDITPPPAPGSVSVVDINKKKDETNSRLIVSWPHISQPSDFKEYRLYRSADSGQNYTQVTSTTLNYYIEESLANTEYLYKVTSADTFVHSFGAGQTKNNEVKMLDAPISSPSNPALMDRVAPTLQSRTENVLASSATLSLGFDESTEAVVKIGSNCSSLSKASANPTSSLIPTINLEKLMPGTSYSYKVVARDSNGNRSESECFSFTTPAFSISNVAKSVAVSSAALKWKANASADSFIKYTNTKTKETRIIANDTAKAANAEHSLALKGL